jgi:hypothetical protein
MKSSPVGAEFFYADRQTLFAILRKRLKSILREHNRRWSSSLGFGRGTNNFSSYTLNMLRNGADSLSSLQMFWNDVKNQVEGDWAGLNCLEIRTSGGLL